MTRNWDDKQSGEEVSLGITEERLLESILQQERANRHGLQELTPKYTYSKDHLTKHNVIHYNSTDAFELEIEENPPTVDQLPFPSQTVPATREMKAAAGGSQDSNFNSFSPINKVGEKLEVPRVQSIGTRGEHTQRALEGLTRRRKAGPSIEESIKPAWACRNPNKITDWSEVVVNPDLDKENIVAPTDLQLVCPGKV